jgi:hypothetical protein
MYQLLAAWALVDKKDIPLNPQILGKPGVGKTTLAYTAAKLLKRPVYIFQATVDTRPEDLLISPVIAENNSIKYHASPLVTAMIKGGVCIIDEGNRMSEKSWASLAPLLDTRRYIESIIAGIKVPAHPDFRICVTMNDDSSTFEIPEYIHSRLQPQIFIEFPEREEEFRILQFNLPFVKEQVITYTVDFLQRAHQVNKSYTVRDGINICRYYTKIDNFHQNKTLKNSESSSKIRKGKKVEQKDNLTSNEEKQNSTEEVDLKLFQRAVRQVLNKEAVDFLLNKSKDLDKDDFPNFFDGSDKFNFLGKNKSKSVDHEEDDLDFEDDFDEEDFLEDREHHQKDDFTDNEDEDLDEDEENNDEDRDEFHPFNSDDVIDIFEDKSSEPKDDNPLNQSPDEYIKDFIAKKQQKKSTKKSSKK